MGSLSRRAALLAAILFGCPVTSALAAPQQAQEPTPGRIRVSVEVVPIDVQVIDRTGQPVPNLGPEKFSVTINGKRRRVVSAEQIRTEAGDEGPSTVAGGLSAATPKRVVMVAVDCISFDAAGSRDVTQNVADFVRGLQPDDYVGLSAYPNGPAIAPTTDHAAVLRALNTIVGQRDGPGIGRFNLRPTEIIDGSRDVPAGTGPTLDALFDRECGQDIGANCRALLISEINSTALYYEGQATASIGMLRNVIMQMQSYPGRKTLLLVSSGMVASDTPGGRPDIGSLGIQAGKEAATANTAIYTLFVDSSLHDRYGAETRKGDRTAVNRSRDTAVLARWLEQFAGSAGGALFSVTGNNATSALARIQNELSSYYLLGVEPADEDRDGRTHEVAVKAALANVTVRGRRWVMIPARGASATVAPAAAPAAAAPASSSPAAVPVRRVVPANVIALSDVFDRSDRQTFHNALAQSTDLPNVIRSFRQSDSPWPANPRRTAVFALELALGGLRSDSRDARDEAGRLLAEYHVRVREPAGADAFECAWLVAEATALEGLFMPDNALLFIPRAVQRCPANPRLQLAYALVSEQQWLQGRTLASQDAEILNRYEQAMKFPDTEPEARVRAARFLYGLGQFDNGLAMLDGSKVTAATPADLELRYFAQLIRGQLLRAAGRPDDAAAAFRAALAAWPGAQSARVALMTLSLSRGNREEAAALAEAIQMAPVDQYDPWWTYWLGDYRAFPAVLDKLREQGR